MSDLLQEAYANKVLDKDVHGTLLQDLDGVATVARIPKALILTSMKQHCSPFEIEYVRKLRTVEANGLIYLHDHETLIRMMSMAAACLRNFIDARVYLLKDLLSGLKHDTLPDPTVMLIPNFCVGKSTGVADWELTHLLGWLYDRAYAGKQTMIGVESMESFQQKMPLIFQHVKSGYLIVPPTA